MIIFGCDQKDYPHIDVRLFDFRNFVYLAFDYLNLGEPTPLQMDMAYWMQFGPKRLQAQAFRGIGKSILAEVFCAWALYIIYSDQERARPEFAILSLSAAGARAQSFSTFVFNLIMGWDMLAHLRPDPNGRCSKINFDVGPAPVQDSPSMRALGITGQMAGARSNLTVMDDVEVPNNSATQMRREALVETVKEVDALIKPLPEDEELARVYPHLPEWLVLQLIGRIVVLGTPQTEETIYAALTKKGYVRRVWPARYPNKKWMENNGEALAPTILEKMEADPSLTTGYGEDSLQGAPTDTRFGDLDLCERLASYARSGFELQFMLNTTLADADRYPLKINDLIVMDIDPDHAPEKVTWGGSEQMVIKDIECVGFKSDRYHSPFMTSPEWANYKGCVMAVDPAGRGKDETTLCVVKILNSQLFVVENMGFGPSCGYEDNVLMGIALTAQKHGVNTIVIEANFGDGMFAKLLTPFLRKIYPVTIEDVTSSVQKEKRIIQTLEPVLNQHKLIIDTGVVRKDSIAIEGLSDDAKLQYQLLYQLSRITLEKGSLAHDDKLDALAMAVKYWTDQMALSSEDQIDKHKEERLSQALKSFMRAAGKGSRRQNQGWGKKTYLART